MLTFFDRVVLNKISEYLNAELKHLSMQIKFK